MRKTFLSHCIVLAFLAFTLSSCGGGSSSSGILIEGTLIEARGTTHAKHTAGAPIEEVEICALLKCSLTDDEGQWGLLVDSDVAEVLLTVNGHGIATTTVLTIPVGAHDVFVELKRVDGDAVVADRVTVTAAHHD